MTISQVTSEALQAELRRLLPSQQGFGTDLSASDTIIPVIDLTAAAEGSGLPYGLQTALSFNDLTSFNDSGTGSSTIISGVGFWRLVGNASVPAGFAADNRVTIRINNGLSSKIIYEFNKNTGSTYNAFNFGQFDLIIVLQAGESIESDRVNARCAGTVRQVATLQGNLVNPSGYIPQ